MSKRSKPTSPFNEALIKIGVPLQRKNAARIPIQSTGRDKLTAYGGLIFVESLLRRWEFWNRLEENKFQPLQSRQSYRKPAQSAIAQLLFALACGATNLLEAGLMQSEELLKRLLGLEGWFDHEDLNSWIKNQDDGSLQALHDLNGFVVNCALQEALSKNPEHALIIDRFSTSNRRYTQWGFVAIGGFLLDVCRSTNLPDESIRGMVERHRSFIESKEHILHTNENFWPVVNGALKLCRWSVELDFSTVQYFYRTQPEWPRGEIDNSKPEAPLKILYSPSKEFPGVIAFEPEGNPVKKPLLLLRAESDRCYRRRFDSHFVALSESTEIEVYLGRSHFDLEESSARIFTCLQMISYNVLAVLRRAFPLDGDRHQTTSEAVRNMITIPAVEWFSANKRGVRLGVPENWPALWKKNLENAARQMLLR